MKLTILTSILLFICGANLFSQDLVGKRIYSGNLSLSLNHNKYEFKRAGDVSTNTNTIASVSFLAGKIKENNAYIAYGFSFGMKSLNEGTSTTQYNLGPVVQFGKFVKIFDSFYYAPKSNFSIAGVWGKLESSEVFNNKGFTVGIDISPLSFVYQIKDKIMLNMSLGQFALDYSYLHSSNDYFAQTTQNFNINGNLSNYTSLGVFYLF